MSRDRVECSTHDVRFSECTCTRIKSNAVALENVFQMHLHTEARPTDASCATVSDALTGTD